MTNMEFWAEEERKECPEVPHRSLSVKLKIMRKNLNEWQEKWIEVQ